MYECIRERRCCNTIIRYVNGSRGPRGPQGENAITDMARIYTAYPGPVYFGATVGNNIPLILNSSIITPESSSAISFNNPSTSISLAAGNYLISYSVTFSGLADATVAVVPFALTLTTGGVTTIIPGSEQAEYTPVNNSSTSVNNVALTIPVVVPTASTLSLVLAETQEVPLGLIINAAIVSIFKLGNIGS